MSSFFGRFSSRQSPQKSVDTGNDAGVSSLHGSAAYGMSPSQGVPKSPGRDSAASVMRPKDIRKAVKDSEKAKRAAGANSGGSHAISSGSEVDAVVLNSIEWVSDRSANSCVQCQKPFNTFKRRRHHCRNCGRVVCWACSTNRLTLQAAHFENKPQRVCDGCYIMLTEKKYALQYAMSIREKEQQLLGATSYIRYAFEHPYTVLSY